MVAGLTTLPQQAMPKWHHPRALPESLPASRHASLLPAMPAWHPTAPQQAWTSQPAPPAAAASPVPPCTCAGRFAGKGDWRLCGNSSSSATPVQTLLGLHGTRPRGAEQLRGKRPGARNAMPRTAACACPMPAWRTAGCSTRPGCTCGGAVGRRQVVGDTQLAHKVRLHWWAETFSRAQAGEKVSPSTACTTAGHSPAASLQVLMLAALIAHRGRLFDAVQLGRCCRLRCLQQRSAALNRGLHLGGCQLRQGVLSCGLYNPLPRRAPQVVQSKRVGACVCVHQQAG